MPSTTFNYTGALQTWVVPAGVTSVTLEVWGAQGGGTSGGKGGYVRANRSVTPGETLRIYVGQRPTGLTGGWNGGGNAGTGGEGNGSAGGGATDVRQGGTALANRVVVAGGGGGRGGNGGGGSAGGNGGEGGPATGQNGQHLNATFQTGGRGGTPSAGGAVGNGDYSASAGALGVGGNGAAAVDGGTGGGAGGGGGLYGGGGSNAFFSTPGGGGGGGSNWLPGAGTTTRGVRTGNGLAIITWFNPPLAPTDVSPVADSIISTDTPLLQATMPVHPDGASVTQRVRWELSASGIGTKSFTQGEGNLKSSGLQTVQVNPGASQLEQAVWTIKARIIDQSGNDGPFSSAHTFTISHPPSTTSHSPTGDGYLSYGTGNITFSWAFTDPSAIDFQTAYEVEVQRTSGTAVVSSGQVVSANQNATLTIPSGEKDNNLRWRVRVRDRDSVWGAFSAWHLFKVGDPPTVTITAPVGEIATANPLATWNFNAGGTRTQTHFQVRFKDDEDFVIFETAWLSGPFGSYQVPQPILENLSNYKVEVRVRDNINLESVWTSANFNTDWTFVESPLVQIDDLYETDGYIAISWDDSRHDSDFFYYRIWRREVVPDMAPGDGWVMLAERSDQPGFYEYQEWLAKSGTTYEYAVTQAANRFGDIVESERFPIEVTPTSSHYWLIHPLFEDFTIKVDKVVSEEFDEEYEQEVMQVIGRGRHVDYGDRLGYSGSITAQFRDYENGLTAREQRMKLEGIKASRSAVYLRNPFGDIWLVSIGDLKIDRISGVGLREFFDVTIPYEEVE